MPSASGFAGLSFDGGDLPKLTAGGTVILPWNTINVRYGPLRSGLYGSAKVDLDAAGKTAAQNLEPGFVGLIYKMMGPLSPSNRAVLDTVFGPKCFPAGTGISSPSGETVAIETLRPGDEVLAYPCDDVAGRGALVPARVGRLFEGITDAWIELSNGLVVTPGHHFLDSEGRFRPIADILGDDGVVVLEDGRTERVTGELIRYSTATADLFEQAEGYLYDIDGSAAVAPKFKLGWRTYNFEVEHFHSYVAGGVRVHNASILYDVQPGDTLYTIGQRYNVSVSALAVYNGIVDPNKIIAGARLDIPDATELAGTQLLEQRVTAATGVYLVDSGDTLLGNALRMGTTVPALLQAIRA